MKTERMFRSWLRRNGMSQRELAGKLGITEGALSKIINGSRRPSWRLALKIARLMDIHLESLFE